MSKPCNRRAFLEGSLRAGAAAGLLLAGGCASGFGPSGMIQCGNIANLPVGSLQAVSGQLVILGRDTGGVYAMSSICPHADCDMETQGTISPSGVFCACHGSRFDTNGAVLQGPARTALQHYQVSIASTGMITVNADKTVSASTRTAVPA